MEKEKDIRVSHLLFDFIGWVDYFDNQNFPVSEIQKLRNDFINAIWNNEQEELVRFCKDVIRLQRYRYKLNGTAGVERTEWIPKGLEKYFSPVPFDPKERIKKLQRTWWNQYDAGIILQDCLLSNHLEKALSIKLTEMNDSQLIYFSNLIDSLEWFSDSQTQFWFTYHAELIPPPLHGHFWFIDENYLGEKDFAVNESRSIQEEKAF
jgi:hypothetical protein